MGLSKAQCIMGCGLSCSISSALQQVIRFRWISTRKAGEEQAESTEDETVDESSCCVYAD